MTRLLRDVLREPGLAMALRANGLERIAERHTCAHRVDELLAIHRSLGVGGRVFA
jgi:spore maturation protein CgeB